MGQRHFSEEAEVSYGLNFKYFNEKERRESGIERQKNHNDKMKKY